MDEYGSGLDLVKLRSLSNKISENARNEISENLKEDLINIVLDEDLKIRFQERGRKVTEQSKRVIGHWVKKGIVHAEQNKKNGWFYFNHTESIWIDIVTMLRQFGLSLDIIKSIRTQLFHEEVKEFPLINFALMHSVLKEPYLMLVDEDGKINLLTESVYSKQITDAVLPPHIVFNFFHLAKQLYPNNNFNIGSNNSLEGNLNTSELKLLYYIRTGDFTEIKIRLKDGNISLFEGEKHISNPESIMHIINEKSYQDIEIKTENGKIVHITSTEKIKFK
jgi:DNA-binding transcriptional MerR regulator